MSLFLLFVLFMNYSQPTFVGWSFYVTCFKHVSNPALIALRNRYSIWDVHYPFIPSCYVWEYFKLKLLRNSSHNKLMLNGVFLLAIINSLGFVGITYDDIKSFLYCFKLFLQYLNNCICSCS